MVEGLSLSTPKNLEGQLADSWHKAVFFSRNHLRFSWIFYVQMCNPTGIIQFMLTHFEPHSPIIRKEWTLDPAMSRNRCSERDPGYPTRLISRSLCVYVSMSVKFLCWEPWKLRPNSYQHITVNKDENNEEVYQSASGIPVPDPDLISDNFLDTQPDMDSLPLFHP